MKKRFSIIGLVFGLFTLINSNLVFGYGRTSFDFVPEPVYNLLRKLLIDFGINPGESFTIFMKVVMGVMVYAIFYYGARRAFGESETRVANVVAISLAALTIILLPGEWLLRMAELYAGLLGLALPLILVVAALQLYKSADIAPLKLLIDCIAIWVVSSTLAIANDATQLPFLAEAIQWFGLIFIFFGCMFLIHLFETFNWAGEHFSGKVPGSGWFSGSSKSPEAKKADALAREEAKLEKSESKDIKTAENLAKLDEKLSTEVMDELSQLAQVELLEHKHIDQILLIIAKLRTVANDLKYSKDSSYISQGFRMFNESLEYFKKVFKDLLDNYNLSVKQFNKIRAGAGAIFNLDAHLKSELNNAETLFINSQNVLNTCNALDITGKRNAEALSSTIQNDILELKDIITKLQYHLVEVRNISNSSMIDFEQKREVISHDFGLVEAEFDKFQNLWSKFYNSYNVGVYSTRFAQYVGAWDSAIGNLRVIDSMFKNVKDNLEQEFNDINTMRVEFQKHISDMINTRKKLDVIYAKISSSLK